MTAPPLISLKDPVPTTPLRLWDPIVEAGSSPPSRGQPGPRFRRSEELRDRWKIFAMLLPAGRREAADGAYGRASAPASAADRSRRSRAGGSTVEEGPAWERTRFRGSTNSPRLRLTMDQVVTTPDKAWRPWSMEGQIRDEQSWVPRRDGQWSRVRL